MTITDIIVPIITNKNAVAAIRADVFRCSAVAPTMQSFDVIAAITPTMDAMVAIIISALIVGLIIISVKNKHELNKGMYMKDGLLSQYFNLRFTTV